VDLMLQIESLSPSKGYKVKMKALMQ